MGEDDHVFGKLKPIRCEEDALAGRRRNEVLGLVFLEPDLPVTGTQSGWKPFGWTSPQLPQAGFGNVVDTLNEVGMFGTSARAFFSDRCILGLELSNLFSQGGQAFGGGEHRCLSALVSVRPRFAER